MSLATWRSMSAEQRNDAIERYRHVEVVDSHGNRRFTVSLG